MPRIRPADIPITHIIILFSIICLLLLLVLVCYICVLIETKNTSSNQSIDVENHPENLHTVVSHQSNI